MCMLQKGGQAPSVIHTYIHRDVGFGTFDQMYETGVMSAVEYGMAIWNYRFSMHQIYIHIVPCNSI